MSQLSSKTDIPSDSLVAEQQDVGQQAKAASLNGDQDDDDSQYPKGLRMAAIIFALFCSFFMVAVSQTVLAAAIPTLTSAFNSYDDVSWYSTGEQITAISLSLPFGRAYALLNNKWVYFFSVVVYLVGSAICGAAPTSVALIVGRTIQGVGLAGVFGGTFIIIARITPLRTRSIYTGLCGAAYVIAAVVGPVIGGAFTTNVSWRWCFYFNLPIGALVIPIIIFFLPAVIKEDTNSLKGKTVIQKVMMFNPFGTILILASLVCLFLALQWGGAEYAWNSGPVIAVLVVFAVTLLPWIWLQYKQGDDATIPFSIIKNRTVAASNLYLFFLNGSFGIFIYYLPIWFQSIDGDSAQSSGFKQIAISVATAISSVLAGGAVAAIGWYNPFMIAGGIIATGGAAMLFVLEPGSSVAYTIGAQILGGVGAGIGAEQGNVAVSIVLPPEKIPSGTSLTLFTRLLGFAVAIPIAQNVFQKALADRLGASVAARIFGSGGATDIRANLANIFGGTDSAEFRAAVLDVNYALTRGFMVCLILAAASVPFSFFVEWKSVKAPKKTNEEVVKEKRDEVGVTAH